jgi:hypothetical protein
MCEDLPDLYNVDVNTNLTTEGYLSFPKGRFPRGMTSGCASVIVIGFAFGVL